MYNNSHIKWTHGMELTAEVFQHQDYDLNRSQQFAVRTVIGDGKTGLLPGNIFNAEGSFVDRTFEFPMLQCTALLPSGRIISVDEPLKVTLPHLTADTTEVFICLGFVEGEVHEFERDGIPYEGPVYELSIHTLNEIYSKDMLPLKRLVVEGDMLSIDANYIVPTLTTDSDEKIGEHLNRCHNALEKLVQSEKLKNTETCRALLYLLSKLSLSSQLSTLSSQLDILQELEFTIDFYIVKQIGSTLEAIPEKVMALSTDHRRECNLLNIAPYLDWIEEFISAADTILQQYVVEEKTIDLDKLKEDIKAELTDDIMRQLYDKLSADLTESLTRNLTVKIENIIQHSIEQLKPELRNQLRELLHDPLYDELYKALYDSLSNLSYKPMEVVDTFVPLI